MMFFFGVGGFCLADFLVSGGQQLMMHKKRWTNPEIFGFFLVFTVEKDCLQPCSCTASLEF